MEKKAEVNPHGYYLNIRFFLNSKGSLQLHYAMLRSIDCQTAKAKSILRLMEAHDVLTKVQQSLYLEFQSSGTLLI